MQYLWSSESWLWFSSYTSNELYEFHQYIKIFLINIQRSHFSDGRKCFGKTCLGMEWLAYVEEKRSRLRWRDQISIELSLFAHKAETHKTSATKSEKHITKANQVIKDACHCTQNDLMQSCYFILVGVPT